ncbi:MULTISPECIES: hypothetical protein [unclassified Bartonella]|uniref:hypothetical protein n=1 Tax=unclassified Bartonella TaxID=2645622 RepID=UPI0035CFF13D
MFGSFNTFGHMVTKPSFGHSHNSRPFHGISKHTHGNACSFNGFANNMISHASTLGVQGGLTGAAGGALFGGLGGALTGGTVGLGGGLIGGAIYGFGQSAWNYWF